MNIQKGNQSLTEMEAEASVQTRHTVRSEDLFNGFHSSRGFNQVLSFGLRNGVLKLSTNLMECDKLW